MRSYAWPTSSMTVVRYCLSKLQEGKTMEGKRFSNQVRAGYRVLQNFVRRSRNPKSRAGITSVASVSPESFFENITMLDDHHVLRKATLSLAGRLPTQDEIESLTEHVSSQLSNAGHSKCNREQSQQRQAFTSILDQVSCVKTRSTND